MSENCIAFKLNYCSGGANANCIGFRGICNDEIMKQNVRVLRRGWCSREDNLCKQFLDKKITREKLEEKWKQAEKEEVDGTCNEGFALKLWYAEAGWVGEPQRPCRIVNKDLAGHLCVLTTVNPYSETSDIEARFVFAMFVIRDVCDGGDNRPDYVVADKKWRLEFRPKKEVEKMKFYSAYTGQTWRQGLFRYFDDATAIKFLERAVDVKRGTPEEDFAKEFLKQYPYK